jgi:hypothetical protein
LAASAYSFTAAHEEPQPQANLANLSSTRDEAIINSIHRDDELLASKEWPAGNAGGSSLAPAPLTRLDICLAAGRVAPFPS